MNESWKRSRFELAHCYAAFRWYLGVPGRRSVRMAWRRARKAGAGCARYAEATWNSWCGEHQWVARAKAWDAYVYEMSRRLAGVTALAKVPPPPDSEGS